MNALIRSFDYSGKLLKNQVHSLTWSYWFYVTIFLIYPYEFAKSSWKIIELFLWDFVINIASMWKIRNKTTDHRDTAAIEGSGAKLWKCPYGKAHLLLLLFWPRGHWGKILKVDIFHYIWWGELPLVYFTETKAHHHYLSDWLLTF